MRHANPSQHELSRLTREELRELARGAGVKGFGSMRKTELVDALAAGSVNESTPSPTFNHSPATPNAHDLSAAALFAASAARPGLKNRRLTADQVSDDSLVIEALDSRWMHVHWSLSSRTLERVVAAMGVDWHLSTPTLRLYRLTCDESGPRSKSASQDCPLPADARQWYLNTPVPGGVWQVELGYLTRSGRFHALMHSLPEELPETSRAHVAQIPLESHEERTRGGEPQGAVSVRLNVELSISGVTVPGARVVINESPAPVDRDGTFQCFATLPDGRIVIPVEVQAPHGRQRILMGVERNTRFLEAELDAGDAD